MIIPDNFLLEGLDEKQKDILLNKQKTFHPCGHIERRYNALEFLEATHSKSQCNNVHFYRSLRRALTSHGAVYSKNDQVSPAAKIVEFLKFWVPFSVARQALSIASNFESFSKIFKSSGINIKDERVIAFSAVLIASMLYTGFYLLQKFQREDCPELNIDHASQEGVSIKKII